MSKRHVGGRAERSARPRIRIRLLALLLVAAFGVAGLTAAGSIAKSSRTTSMTISLRKTSLGRVLTFKGHTLYLFKKDKHGKSTCNGSCAKFWPPLLRHGKVTLGSGLKKSMLGTTKRSNGTRQITYNKHPLYTFVLDTHTGQTNGQAKFEFGAKWYVVSAKGAAVLKAPGSTSSTTPPPPPAGNSCPYPPC